jgi:hypothetical protein
MLISMPTSTSTIFGVFQVIGVSQALLRRDVHAGVKGKAAPDVTQAFTSTLCVAAICNDIF